MKRDVHIVKLFYSLSDAMERRVVTFLHPAEVDDAVCKSTLSRSPHQLFHFYVQLTDGGLTETTPASFSIAPPCSPPEQCPSPHVSTAATYLVNQTTQKHSFEAYTKNT
jgi:hypothetical protein